MFLAHRAVRIINNFVLGCYFCREPRGFGFVKFRYADDAAVAKQQMNHQLICGREISIVYAEENRKTPQEMRTNSRIRYFITLFFSSVKLPLHS